MAKISIDEGKITVRLSQRNVDELNSPYTPPEYSLWKRVTVNGEDVWLNIVLEQDDIHYAPEV